MLYNNFIVCMMVCAFFALLSMIDNQEWHYIILPIGILIWGIFKFFDEDDREYLRRLGIDPDEFNAFFPDDYNGKYNINTNVSHPSPRRNGNTITWSEGDMFDSDSFKEQVEHRSYHPTVKTYNVGTYQNPFYKTIVKKCKRNFKISINNTEKDEQKSSRKPIFHGNNNFAWRIERK